MTRSNEASRRAVVDALLKYGATLQITGGSISHDKEADTLLWSNPFAFLLGVIFDQDIVAEQAWQAPYQLCKRLGHLDQVRMVSDPESVRRAVKASPALHPDDRMPEWIVKAAERVQKQYGGDASAIWAVQPSADELQWRLREFAGIGQKKATMTVKILADDRGQPIQHMEELDIPVDRQVRRVFLRTRLADRDDTEHIALRARELHPARPIDLDSAWDVGRHWCYKTNPNCDECQLAAVCPRDIAAARGV